MLRDRFEGGVSERMRRFSSSIEIDLAMLREDVEGSIAHATMLGEVGLLSGDEAARLCEGLARVRDEIESGAWLPGDEHEDVHMAVEARLAEHIGDPAGKLHTARSRNDQVATDVRLWIKRRASELDDALDGLLTVLLERVERDGRTLLPGYTHLQRGQPILLGHQLLAHAWALARDRQRLRDAVERQDLCPLGAGALAGTPHPIDRARTAELLGFAGPVENAMDAVAARDHLQEVVATCAICTGHLSRMAEELVLWSSREFGLVRLADAHSTGSSIMPQKRNPDAAELVRGASALVAGELTGLLSLTRALPMAYNRDLQHDKPPLMRALELTIESVGLTAEIWSGLTVERERFEEALRGDFSLATELADLLVGEGVPFREAHGIVARAVRWCEEQGSDLSALTPEEAGRFLPGLARDLSEWLDARAAAERRTSLGGTAWSEIERQVALLRSTGLR